MRVSVGGGELSSLSVALVTLPSIFSFCTCSVLKHFHSRIVYSRMKGVWGGVLFFEGFFICRIFKKISFCYPKAVFKIL